MKDPFASRASPYNVKRKMYGICLIIYNETENAGSRCARFHGTDFTEVIVKSMVYRLFWQASSFLYGASIANATCDRSEPIHLQFEAEVLVIEGHRG